MSKLDDDLIASACQYRAKPHKTYLFPRMLAAAACLVPVSYTHLDVYKRQLDFHPDSCYSLITERVRPMYK